MYTSKKLQKNNIFFDLIEALPFMLSASFVGFSVVCVGLLVLNQLQTSLVLFIGLPVAVALGIVTFLYTKNIQRPGSVWEKRVVDILVLIAVLVWGAWNMQFTSQHILTDRDPATYATTAAWLVNHDDLNIEISKDEFGENDALTHGSAGFSNQDGVVEAQGLHLLPTLLALSGRIVGESEMLRLVPLLGMIALLMIYAFARLLVRPRWALLAIGIVGATLPMIYFSRGTYTEPLMAAFAFSTLAFLWVAQQKQKLFLWLLAGLAAGAATMTRIDAYLFIAAIAVAIVVWVAMAQKGGRRRRVVQATIFTTGGAISATLGWLDVMTLSSAYYAAHADLILQVLALIVAIIILGALYVALCWLTPALKYLDNITKGWRGPMVMIVIILLGIGLASRPLWMTSATDSQNEIVSAIQLAQGSAIEGRDYAEQTVNWLVWYIGIVSVGAGLVGMAWAAYLFIVGRNLLLGAFVFSTGLMTLVYLWSPGITPDHLWAARRFLPITIPGLAIFTVLILDQLDSLIAERFKEWSRYILFTCAAVVCIVPPAITTAPFASLREKTQVSIIDNVCASMPQNAAIVWVGMARLEMVQPTRSFCGMPVVGYDNGDQLTKENLSEIAQNVSDKGMVPIIGGYGYQGGIFEAYGQLNSMSTVAPHQYNVIQSTLERPPTQSYVEQDAILVAKIQKDGSLIPLAE